MSELDITMKIKMGQKSFKGIKDLSDNKKIDESDIESLCSFVDARYDCADFRVIVLLKTIYAYKNNLSNEIISRIKESLLNFKYWMDEPGDDSLCFWSENHQLIFHTCEYLSGLLYFNDEFSNSKMTGKEHVKKAKDKILLWLEYKWKYGFIEWHSNTYYEEDIAPLALLIDHAQDNEIVIKAKMILDLLLLDMAMYSYDGYFSATSGRCYEKQKKDGNAQDTLDIYKYVFDASFKDFDYERISSVFLLCENYEVPSVLKSIAKDNKDRVLKDSMGLDLKEIKSELDIYNKNTGGAFLWQMEAFTNKESIEATIDMFNDYCMEKNDFLKDLKMVNIKILRKLRLLPFIIKIANPSTQGVAIQRSNTYAYKTKNYMLSTSMRYHPGEFGDQHHIWNAALPNNIQVFTTHPGEAFFDDNARNFSPSYWVGNGILPDSIQEKNIHMSIYKVNQRKGMLERSRPKMSHAYFPFDKFDEVKVYEKDIFGKINNTYIRLSGVNPLEIKINDVIQKGHITAWICELKEANMEFSDFIKEELRSLLMLKGKTLIYKNMSLKHKGKYIVDTKEIKSVQYDRFESPYVKAKRKAEKINVNFNNQSLVLDFENLIRKID